MARKQPRLHCGGVVIAPLFREKHRGAPAVRLDTDSNVSVCPMMHRHYPAGIFFKVLSRKRGKGQTVPALVTIEEISLISRWRFMYSSMHT